MFRLQTKGKCDDLEFKSYQIKWFNCSADDMVEMKKELNQLKIKTKNQSLSKINSHFGDRLGYLSKLFTLSKFVNDKRTLSLVNFFTTQHLSGTGAFGLHLKRIGKQDTDNCKLCNESSDRSTHRLFNCKTLNKYRENLLYKHDIYSVDDLFKCLKSNESINDFKLFCKISLTSIT